MAPTMTPTLVVLVTGCAGFIGSHTVDTLLAGGYRVLGIDDLSSGHRSNLAQSGGHPRFAFVEADIAADLDGVLKQATAQVGPIERIVHLAAQTMVPLSIMDPVRDVRVNIEGTVRILDYARRHAVKKVVFASSSAVFDDDAAVPVNEDSPVRPSSPYAIGKLGGELFLDYYARIHGLNYTALRFMNVYGPRQDPDSAYSGVISIFLDRALAHAPITIFGDGGQTRDFVHVRDVINLGTGEETRIDALARLILDLTASRSAINHAPARPGDIRYSVTRLDRARDLLGFQPSVDLREGLADTLAWVRGRQAMAD